MLPGVDMKKLAAALLAILTVCGTAAQAAEWWIPDPGCVTTVNVGPNYDRTMSSRRPFFMRWQDTGEAPDYYTDFEYTLDTDGDLCMTRWEWMCCGMHSAVFYTYDPPLKILDYPLTDGKTWTATSVRHYSEFSRPVDVSVTGSVIGSRVVETVVGPLAVVEVTLDYSWGTQPQTYLLNEQLGNVKDLVSVTGCEAVATESLNWGSLKANYR